MKKYVLLVTLAFVCLGLPVYSDNASSLEDATVEVASEIGKSVVSISSVVKETMGRNFQFGSPFEGSENDPFQRFFEDFFGGMPEREFERKGLWIV